MKRTVLTILGISGFNSLASAQSLDLSWNTIDGGGTMFTTGPGGYELSATIGQPDAGMMSGDTYQLLGGFWAVASPAPCLGDINGDRSVSLNDLAVLLAFRHAKRRDAGQRRSGWRR